MYNKEDIKNKCNNQDTNLEYFICGCSFCNFKITEKSLYLKNEFSGKWNLKDDI